MSKRILLIDSDETFAKGLSSAMNARGFIATMATNSEQGMTLAKSESPDLIVVCVEAQPTNGYMLCTRLKKDEALKGIPVILTSALATPDSFEKHKKLKTRAEEYLIKPFAPQLMLEKASALLGVSLPPEMPEEDEIVSMEDEPLGLGDLVDGEDEPISLSEQDAAEAHAGNADDVLVVDEVEEVTQLDEHRTEAQGEADDLEMFDKAFDSLGGGAAQTAEDQGNFGGLHLAPALEAEHEAVAEEPLAHEPTELTAPDDDAVLHGLLHDGAGHDEAQHPPLHDDEARHALEARVAELEQALAERQAELEQARKFGSANDSLKAKEAKNKSDKEVLRLKEELHAKEKELLEVQEQQTSLESQAQQLKDDAAKREAAAKALQQRADALAAAAKKFERELGPAREEAKQVAGLKARLAELEKLQAAHAALVKTHDELAGDVELHKTRVDELSTELAGVHEMHAEDLETARAEASAAKSEGAAAKAEVEAAKAEAQTARAEAQTVKGEVEKHQTKAGELETELAGVREMQFEELEKVKGEAEQHKAAGALAQTELEGLRGKAAGTESELEKVRAKAAASAQDLEYLRKELLTAHGDIGTVRAEVVTAKGELDQARLEVETVRTDVTALAGEKELLSEERDELKKQLEEARLHAVQNEDRAVKAYQKIKSDEKLREKTRKALQIALQLLEESAEGAESVVVAPEKQSA